MLIYDEHITHSSAWTRADIEADASWQYTLTAEDIADLKSALSNLTNQDRPLLQITREEFALPVLGPRLAIIEQEVSAGRGFFLLRGLPVGEFDLEDLLLMNWGIGTYMGNAISQNTYGDVLGHVFDHQAADPKALRTRGYQTSDALDFHVDRADMTSLLCLRQGRAGGRSRLISSMAIHNAIRGMHPEHLAPLYDGLPYITTEAVGETQIWNGPVFDVTDGVLNCSFRRATIQTAIDTPGVKVSEDKRAALAYIDGVMQDPELIYEMDLSPGDIQFVNNYTVLHGRTAFIDGDRADSRRHLTRLWLKFFSPRPASEYIRDQYKGIAKQVDYNPTGFRTQ